VCFVLALAMFPRLGYLRVWGKLTAGLAGLDLLCPSEKALRELRRRLGPAPLKALLEVPWPLTTRPCCAAAGAPARPRPRGRKDRAAARKDPEE